jgi:hypothetical protein
MYVVSNLFGSKGTASTACKAATLDAVRKADGVIPKNSNRRHHSARVPSGKGAVEMPFAATVESRMLRFFTSQHEYQRASRWIISTD